MAERFGQRLGEGWEQVCWEKVGNKLGKGWENSRGKVGKSWEKVETSWVAVENRAKLGTSWETRGKELGNGC